MLQMLEKSPNWNYAHICKNILPTLRKGGVGELNHPQADGR
jgi:predicted metal-dependent phosphotriesterase family hydrolase